jgi:hypothetical protein
MAGKRLLKIGGIAGAALVVVLLAVAFFVYSNRGAILKRALEKVLSHVLQTTVTVGGVEVMPVDGVVEIRDLKIANPTGFDGPEAMAFGRIRAEVDLASFGGDTPTIRLVEIEQAAIRVDATREGTNIGRLLKNAKRLAGDKSDATPEDAEAQRKMTIRTARLVACKVSLHTSLVKMDPLELTLPDLTLNDIGQTTPAEATGDLLKAILEGIRQNGGGRIPRELAGAIEGSLEGVRERLREAQEHLGEQIQGEVRGELEKGAEKLREGIGGLLGGNREEP